MVNVLALSPDENIVKPALVADEQGNQIRYESVGRSGVYKLEFKSEGVLRRDYFAVNIDTEGESRLKAAKDSEVKSKLGERARILTLDDSPQEIVMSTGGGRELSSRLLIIALILMMVEIILANRRRLGDKIQNEFGGQNQNP